MHQSKKVVGEYSMKENFEIAFEYRFSAVFREMGRLNDDSTEYQRRIRSFLEPHREKFMQELARLKELQREVKTMDLEFVNCHGSHPRAMFCLLTITKYIF